MTSTTRSDVDLSVDEEAVVAFTQELVRVRSVHDPVHGGGEAPAAELVATRMRALGWDPQVQEVAPGRPNVVAVLDGGGGPGPTLMFEGHTDVVTEGDLTAWTVDPYGAEIRDGRLHGRGSADMKSGVAAMIYAAKAVQDAGPFPGRIVVGALVDEEGLMLGAKHFARTPLAAEVDGVIVCEPEEGEICAVAKGAVRLRIELTGVMAHGAMPQHARNPLPVAARIITGLERVQQTLQDQHGEHEHLGWTYLTPTVSLAGDVDQINVIPARATVCVDTRTIPGVDHEAMVAGGDRDGAGGRRGQRDPASTSRWSTTARPWTPRWTTRWWPRSQRRTSTSSGNRPCTAACPAPPTARSSPATRDWRPWSTAPAASGSPTRPTSSSRWPTSSGARASTPRRPGGSSPGTPHDRRAPRTDQQPRRRGRHPGRARHPPRRRLAVRHDGRAAPGPAAPSAGWTCAVAARAPGRPTSSTRATPSSASTRWCSPAAARSAWRRSTG